ncbi:PLDc N-terminal domain-containing protein [Cellulomonas wangsupingiae]|uniref:PLDc N-terminal domain-containing protein n=1 Tax=Cellulomonas wangsupingiae TaxID=2968085 RepID=A0ABY5K756_9CELL|nr:PLDc N-terminal domain-containing protein [Cellulomonas wangsupingiae]MCC2335117.1 PLDc N-terminal domain-containing protein [Cellulomonas wangsupingiae]UUI65613.1 PLDc N-terminal domain-containing protein [Cellulomonas wangsupingiae]
MFVNVSYTHLVIVVVYLAAMIAALTSVWRSSETGTGWKVYWTGIVVLLPYLGPLLWAINLAFSARHRSTPSGA